MPLNLDLPMAIRSSEHDDITSDVLEADDLVHPATLDLRLTLQFQAELEEEHLHGLKVVVDDKDLSNRMEPPAARLLALSSIGRFYNGGSGFSFATDGDV